jgi:hypothetical protein
MHDRFDWLGRAEHLTDEAEGIVATFRIADIPEGDAWLEDHGDLVKLSPEVRNIVRDSADFGTAELTGAALVDEGAFESAALFAADKVEATFHDPANGRGIVPPYVEDAAVQHDPGRRPHIEQEFEKLERPAESDNRTDVPTPEGTPEEEEEAEEAPDDEEDAMADAIAPNEMLGGRRKAPTITLTKAGFFAAVNTARRTGDRTALAPYVAEAEDVGLFALSPVKFDGAGGLLTDAAYPGSWLGQLWQGKRFQRRIVPLLTQGSLTALSMTGWVWGVKPAMAAWAGNKTAVPSNAPTVTPKAFGAVRFAGGHDLAREYYDFNVTEVIDSYGDAMVDSYAMLSDAYALTQVTAGATPYTPDPANTVNTGLLDIVDGALAVVAAGGTPSWAIVAPDIFKGILATPREDALDYFSATIGLESGAINGGGAFTIVPDARLAAGAIIVGDKAGATAWELPGVPIRVSAPDLVLGGVDNAFFGYIGVGVTTPAVVVKNTGVVGTSEGTLLEGVEESVTIAAEKSRK